MRPVWTPRAMCSALENPRHTPVWHGAHLNLCWPLFATLQANASYRRACASRNVTKHPSTQEQSMLSVIAVYVPEFLRTSPRPQHLREFSQFLWFFFPALSLLSKSDTDLIIRAHAAGTSGLSSAFAPLYFSLPLRCPARLVVSLRYVLFALASYVRSEPTGLRC